jgi:PKD domain
VEFVVATLVVLGFIAIIARFAPRDDAGRVRLPGIVDQSIAMWALRRVTGRPLGVRTDDAAAAAGAAQPRTANAPTIPASAGGAGRAGPAPAASARFVASAARLQALGIHPSRPASSVLAQRPPTATSISGPVVASAARLQALGIHPSRPASSVSAEAPPAATSISGPTVAPRRRWRAAPSGATERRLAAVAAAAILAVAALALGAGLLAGEPAGKVLGETGRPALNVASSASASEIAVQPSVALASTSPSAETSTPVVTPKPTPAQTRGPSPTSKAAPTAPPAPIAGFSYVVSGTTVTFTDESTGTGLTYSWDFGDASTSTLRDPVHRYANAATRYVVMLTITDALGRSALDSQVVPVH